MIKFLTFLSTLAICLTSARMTVTQYKVKQKELKDVRFFMEGFIEGAIGAQFDAFANCELDAIFEFKTIVQVVKELVNGEDRAALEHIEEMIQALPKVAEKCPAAFRDETMLADWKAWVKKQIANPKVFIEHALESLVVNEADIRSKVDDAINNYKADDFFNLGIDIGSLISETTLGLAPNSSHQHPTVSQEHQGFYGRQNEEQHEEHPWFTEIVDKHDPEGQEVLAKYNESLYNEQYDKMEARDTASYELLVGFVERAKELTSNSEDLIRNPNLNLSQYEFEFNHTRMWIFKPIQASFRLYKHQLQVDPDQSMAAWRVLRPLSHIFLDYTEQMEDEELINSDLVRFIQLKAWSLQSYEADDNNTVIIRLTQKAYDLFQAKQYEDNYTACGEILADIAWILENPEKNEIEETNDNGLYIHHKFGLHHFQSKTMQEIHQKTDGFDEERDGFMQ